MEIQAVTGVGMDYQRLDVVEQAQRVVTDRQAVVAGDKQVAVGQSSPNVTTSVAFSPALYAQAAQFQLYSQSGTLAAMLGAQQLTPPAASTTIGKEIRIEAVTSSAGGARLDTQA